MRTIQDVISQLPKPEMRSLPVPNYLYNPINERAGLAVLSMKDHMTDEGWQIFQGLEYGGYTLFGHGITSMVGGTKMVDVVNVRDILEEYIPSVVVVQDKREWESVHKDFRDPNSCFQNVGRLKDYPQIFKLTILKDSHQRPSYHMHSANEIGCNAWIIYYHPDIVCHLAPYVRKEHLIRTYHTIDSDLIPPLKPRLDRCILSGALGAVYPLRTNLAKHIGYLPKTMYQKHPGYHRNGCHTPKFLELLQKFKVSICTSSIYGYSLRKIIESTAAGCMVITDLPKEDVLPEIDDNLVRVSSNITPRDMAELINECYLRWTMERQQYLSDRCKRFYDYRSMGIRLSDDIEKMRKNYVPFSTNK